SPMKTGFAAVKLALAGFIVPYMFIYNQQLLLEGVTFSSGLRVTLTACIGVLLIAVAAEGYLFGKINVLIRILAFVGAFLLIDGGLLTDVAGIAVFVVILVCEAWKNGVFKKAAV
ncbi:MAG: C4-dicarboxylate ABC transporter permease, partial [Lachnospiraceae bacterium]|nr:C4-dicarboxylate ABC transporter permease [Lachnospiraceae bacterium]